MEAERQSIRRGQIERFFLKLIALLSPTSAADDGVISPKKPQQKEAVKICDYLWGKSAAVNVSIDSLFWRDKNAPGEFWTDQKGSPFQDLLLFKSKHPQLKVTITFTPRNLYGLYRMPRAMDASLCDVRNAPDWVKQWIIGVQKNEWIEIANHGLTHYVNARLLDKAEFDPYHNPNALDPTWCRERVKEVRKIFAEVRVNNSEIIGFRGPEFRWTDALIDALVEYGFLYVLVKATFPNILRPTIREIGPRKTFLETFRIYPFHFVTQKNSQILFIPCNARLTDRDFKNLYSYVVLRHGVISFFYHFNDKLYEEFDERLTFLETFDHNQGDGLNGDELWWCTTGELAKYWIKKENTTIKQVTKHENTWKIEIKSDSSLQFPTSILLRINPNDISRITRDGKELAWTKAKDGLVVTDIFPQQTSSILVEFRREPRIEEPIDEAEEIMAQEIYSSWIRRAKLTKISNGFSLLALFLTELAFLLATEAFRLRSMDSVKCFLAFVIAIGLCFGVALKSGILTTRLTATGYEPIRKYWLYVQNVTLNGFRVVLPLNKYALAALLVFIAIWLLLFWI